MSEALEPSGSQLPTTTQIVIDRNKRMVMDYLAGKTHDALAGKYGMPQELVKEMIRAGLDDIQSAQLHQGIQAEIVLRLLDDIRDLEEWEENLEASYKISKDAIISVAGADGRLVQEVVTLKEEASDKIVKPKYKAEKRALYQMLMAMVRMQPLDQEKHDGKKTVNTEILDALVATARNQGRAEERLAEIKTVTVDVIDGDVNER